MCYKRSYNDRLIVYRYAWISIYLSAEGGTPLGAVTRREHARRRYRVTALSFFANEAVSIKNRRSDALHDTPLCIDGVTSIRVLLVGDKNIDRTFEVTSTIFPLLLEEIPSRSERVPSKSSLGECIAALSYPSDFYYTTIYIVYLTLIYGCLNHAIACKTARGKL